MGPLFKCRAFEIPLRGDFLTGWKLPLLLLGEYAPRLLRLTVFRLEIGVHIPPPLGIPLGCVLGFAKDAFAAGAPAFVVASPENS